MRRNTDHRLCLAKVFGLATLQSSRVGRVSSPVHGFSYARRAWRPVLQDRRLHSAEMVLLLLLIFALIAGQADVTRAGTIVGDVTITSGGAAQRHDLARTVLYLDEHPSLDSDPPRNDQRPQVAQRGKAFTPDLLVMVQGTTVEFPNFDPFSHNVFSRSRAASFDLDRYPQGQSKSYQFNTVGVVQVFCNIHPQMKAVLVVTPNRYFTRCDHQGRYILRDVPPGQYVWVAFHERAGEVRQTIEVPAGVVRSQVTLTADSPRGREGIQFQRVTPRGPSHARSVDRGLGVKRERLNLPVVNDAHPAPRR